MAVNDDDLASYGKGFENIEEGDAVSKKPLSIENQIVTDEKGRRRFHGAFTGGFSAGHFNTVGSIEGWTPSTFKSDRSTRADKKSFRPEDFMDKDDLGEYGIAPRSIKTTKDFTEDERKSAAGSNDRDRKRQLAWEHTELAAESDRLADLIKPVSESIGVQMLKRMGWRPGKGVGPLLTAKVKQKLAGHNDVDGDISVLVSDFKFAPDDVDFHVFEPKSDLHGLGYAGLDPAAISKMQATAKEVALKITQKQKKGIQGQAFGVGAFEEDDEDVYGGEDLTKYDFALGGSVPSRFDDNKEVDDDFEPSKNLLPPRTFYPPPKISRDYVPRSPFNGKAPKKDIATVYASNSVSNPVERAAQLGESHSIWSLVSSSDRERIEEIKKTGTSRNDTGGVQRSRFDRKTPPKTIEKVIEKKTIIEVEKVIEKSASDTLVFADDIEKQKRYNDFLLYLKRGLVMPQPLGTTDWEWESEQDEFRRYLPQDLKDTYADAKLRQKPLCTIPVSQPFAFLMKSKFTHATFDEDAERQTNEDEDKIKAVQLKMFGAMTREKHEWHPHRNLCKRFNLPNPYPESRLIGVPHFQKEPKLMSLNLLGDSFQSTSVELSRRQALAAENEQKMQSSRLSAAEEDRTVKLAEDPAEPDSTRVKESEEENDVALEEERLPMDLFREIFAESGESSDSSDDDTETVAQPAESATMSEDVSVGAIRETFAALTNPAVYEQPPDPAKAADNTNLYQMPIYSIPPENQLTYGPALPEFVADKLPDSGTRKKYSKTKKDRHSRKKDKKRNSKKHSKKSSSKSKRQYEIKRKHRRTTSTDESTGTSESESD